MNLSKYIILFGLLLSVVGWFFIKPLFWDGEEAAVLKVIKQLEVNCEVKNSLNLAQVSVRLNSLNKLFFRDVAVTAIDQEKVFSSLGWQTIKENFLLGSRLFTEMNIQLNSMSITVIDSSAMVDFIIRATGKDMRDVYFSEQIEAHIELEKSEGDWRVAKIEGERVTP